MVLISANGKKKKWIDQYTGKSYGITTSGFHGDQHTARVKTYGDVIREYECHAESKCADVHGDPCRKQTVGLLQRRHIEIQEIRAIGKESHSLEEVESGLIHSPQNVYTEYPDPQRDEWQTKMVPALRNIPLQRLEKLSGMSRRALIYVRIGRMRPHKKRQETEKNCRKSAACDARPGNGGTEFAYPTKTLNVSDGGNVNTASSEMQGGERCGSRRKLLLPSKLRPTRFRTNNTPADGRCL